MLYRFLDGQRCPDTGLGIEAEGTTRCFVRIPVDGGDILVGTCHLRARGAGEVALQLLGRDNHRTVVEGLAYQVVMLFEGWSRTAVAARKPCDDGGMVAQIAYLVVVRLRDESDVFIADDAAIIYFVGGLA